ncbi:MAG: glycosyltransferase family 39 protein [Anaerolineae bacterium]
MSTRMSFWLAVLILLIAAGLRLWQLIEIPPGLHAVEITDIRIADDIRRGQVEVFYNLGDEGREGLYHMVLAAVTAVLGSGMIGYHILSVWAGLLTLALVYALAARLYGPLPGVAALGLLAVAMFPIILSRTISREVFVPMLVAGAMLAIARAFPVYQQDRRHRPPTTIPFAALGVVLGLAFYTHPVGFAITLFSVAFIIYMLLSRQPMGRRTLNYTSFAVLVMIIIIMPYLLSSIRQPNLGGAQRLLDSYNQSVRPLLETLWAAVSGIFFVGDQNPAYNLPGRPLIDLISGFLVVIGIVTAVRYWRLPRYALPLIAAVALLPSVLLARNSPYFPSYSALLPLLALFFAVGIKNHLQQPAPHDANRWRCWRGHPAGSQPCLDCPRLFHHLGTVAGDARGLQRVSAIANYVDRTADLHSDGDLRAVAQSLPIRISKTRTPRSCCK